MHYNDNAYWNTNDHEGGYGGQPQGSVPPPPLPPPMAGRSQSLRQGPPSRLDIPPYDQEEILPTPRLYAGDAFPPDQPPYSPVDYSRPPAPRHPQVGGVYHPSQGYPSSNPAQQRRPVSDPNEISLGALRMSDPDVQSRNANYVPPMGNRPSSNIYAEQGGEGLRHSGAAASVYSLDSGMGAYGQPQGYGGVFDNGQRVDMTGRSRGPSWDGSMGGVMQPMTTVVGPAPVGSYAASHDFLGQLPPPGPANYPNGQPGPSNPPPANIVRHTSSASSISFTRTNTDSIGSIRARRKGTMAAVDVNKPPYTKQFVDDYRARMKGDPDPEAQFAFAKYLIEAARIVGDDIGKTDPKLGRRYRDSLLAESLKNIKKLATGNDAFAEAQFFLANMYGTGQLGLTVDYEKAYQLYMQASKQNHPAATYRTAVCNELGAGTRKEPNRAVLFYRKAATLRDTAAMYKLGMVLLGGMLGQPRNPREGITWLRRAAQHADEDNPHALHELAMLHENPSALGAGQNIVLQDNDMARELYTQAAQLGYAPSQFKLGTCYEYGGLGCGIDPRRSIAWLSRAAEKGDPEAELALSGWFLTGAEGILKQSDGEAYLWARKSANKGLAKAEYAVGFYTENGIGVKQDLELAKRWYMRAAAQHNKQAMQRLTDLKKGGTGRSARPTRQEAQEGGCVVA